MQMRAPFLLVSAQIFPQTSMRLIFHHGSLSGFQNNYGSWRKQIRLLRKKFQITKEFLICTQGIKDTVHDYINFNGIFYMLVLQHQIQEGSTHSRTVPSFGVFHYLRPSELSIYIHQKKDYFQFSVWRGY